MDRYDLSVESDTFQNRDLTRLADITALGACKLSRRSQARAAATRSLVGLICYKLKEIYALCENFIYIGPLPILSLGWCSVPGLTGLMEHAGLAVIHDRFVINCPLHRIM